MLVRTEQLDQVRQDGVAEIHGLDRGNVGSADPSNMSSAVGSHPESDGAGELSESSPATR